jgi:hypothetical protein
MLFLVGLGIANAEVQRIEIQTRTDEGAFERIVARVFFAVDPKLPANQAVADIALASVNAQGKVEFSSDLLLLRPKNPAKSRKSVFLEVVNRGGPQSLGLLSGARGRSNPQQWDMGDHFLLEQGFTFALLGWQFDVTKGQGLTFQAPTAHVQGTVRETYIDTDPADHPVGFRVNYCAANPNDASARLVFHTKIDAPAKTVPHEQWHFSQDGCAVIRDKGMGPGLYEVIYQAKDPAIAGLGLAAFRDFASYLKYGGAAKELRENPGTLEKVIAYGYSQSGRFLRQFLNDGFNSDEKGRMAFDGIVVASAGAGGGSFNHRFAIPGNAGNSVLSILRPVDMPPFQDDGLLQKEAQSHTVPKIFYTFTSTEYWARAGALIHTSADAKRDIALDKSSRLYFIPGTEHSTGPFPPARRTAAGQQYENYMNFGEQKWVDRALVLAMDAWVHGAKEPPTSRYPTITKSELVKQEAVKFPKVPGFTFPEYMPQVWKMDFGPDFESKRVITQEPPMLGAAFEVLVPQVDATGNDMGGVRIPEVVAPLGTHMGWNVTVPQLKDLHYLSGLLGSFIPLSTTREERMKNGDSRLSVAERYKSREDYLGQIRKAANDLVRGRLMLASDIPHVEERAAATWDWVMKQ